MKEVYTEKKVLSGERDTSYYITGEGYPYLIICNDGFTKWKKDDIDHRTDGPCEIWLNKSKFWSVNNKCNRTDGPANLYSDGSKFWSVNNKWHRTDGPDYINGYGKHTWCIDGKKTTQENIEKLQEKYFYKWKRKMNF